MKEKSVYQFKIILLGIKLLIWRRIQVPSTYNFWDLHVAIQNAMGWYDCHLHEFVVKDLVYGEEESIGIPQNEDPDDSMLPGWKIKIQKYVSINPKMRYIYDFGDNWEHEIKFEGEYPKLEGIKYPICLDGKRACPPEDIGGTFGYEDFIEARQNPNTKESQDIINRVVDSFDTEHFDPTEVLFYNPTEHRKNRLIEIQLS